jgi:putative heme transporter
VLLWIALVISIPLSGFHPVYASVAIVGAVLLAVVAALIFGITRGEKRAARILRAIGERIPGLGGDRLERVVLQAAASIRALGTNPRVLIQSLTWAALNWLLDAASLWCFIAAFGGYPNPVGLFAAYGIANVLGAIPVTPGGLGIIDTVTPVLLVGFGLTRSVATLGVLGWRLVNFWLPIPTGALAYVSLKVPRGTNLRSLRRALSELTARDTHADRQPAQGDEAGAEHEDDSGSGSGSPAAGDSRADSSDARR